MTKKMGKTGIGAGFVIGLFAAALIWLGIPAMAANYSDAQQADGSTIQFSFDKYLVMPENSPVPAATFRYTITGRGNAQTYDTGKNRFEILDGIVAGSGQGGQTAPVIRWDSHPEGQDSTVRFSPSDPTTSFSAAGSSQRTVKGLESGLKYVMHTAQVSFSGIRFPEPGVYRYRISEQPSGQRGITDDDTLNRYLDVYVEDQNGSLVVSGCILLTAPSEISMKSGRNTVSDKKSSGFTNRYESYCLELSKTVSGNQASRDKYFKFHVKIENAVDGTVYDVSLADDGNGATKDGAAEASPAGNSATVYAAGDMSNPEKMTVANNSAEADFYLQHGQKIVIRGIVENTKVTVTETPEDYKASYQMNQEGASQDGSEAVIEAVSADSSIAFTNERSGVIPTGVVVTILPYALAAAAAGAGIIFFRRRREDEE